MLALQGAQTRVVAESRIVLTAAYLSGMLTHCDPKKAPKLEDILGEKPAKEAGAPEPGQEDPKANARAWMAVLNGLSSKRRKRGKEGDE